jgi:hypothetical protein
MHRLPNPQIGRTETSQSNEQTTRLLNEAVHVIEWLNIELDRTRMECDRLRIALQGKANLSEVA